MKVRERQKQYTEQEIVEGIKNDNNAIIEDLLNKIKPKVFKWVLANSGTIEDAEDNLDNTWEKVLINIKTGRYKPGNFEGFFITVSRNIWLKELRDRSIERKATAINNEMKDFSEEELNVEIEKENNLEIVHQHFMQLDKKCRDILTKKYSKGIKMKDIAHQIGSTEEFMKVKMFRCREKLLRFLKDDPNFTIE